MSTPLPVPNNKWPADPLDVPEFDNEPGEILQEQEDENERVPPIATTVEGTVHSVNLPAKSGGYRQFDLTAATAVRVLDRDPRRKRAVLQVFDTLGASNGARLGGTQAEGTSANAFLLALPGPGIAAGNVASNFLEVTHTDEVWASASGENCALSVLNEQWAE